MTLPATRSLEVDIAVIGAGFSGSLAAMALARRGFDVALIERGRHPRFAIGESTTPLTNLLLESLADAYDLPEVRPFSKWGSWQRARPDIACGLKRGFTFLFHGHGRPFLDDDEHRHQLLVAASPNDEVADTHWYRPHFDSALVEYAQQAGVRYLDDTRIERFTEREGGASLEGTRNGHRVIVDADFVIDASGPGGCLSRLLPIQSSEYPWLPPTQGLYAHFTHVRRASDVCLTSAGPPYPPDDAALHHVFPGGWIWVLRFGNGVTSAGAALTDSVAADVRAHDGASAWHRLLRRLPSVDAQFEGARAVTPFIHSPRIAYRSTRVVGETWALLPSAAGVIDPLLSTGFPQTLLGLHRLLDILNRTTPGGDRQRALKAYEGVTLHELDVTARLVGALYATMDDPEMFRRLSLLYFAAVSFSEASRRLDRAERAPGFLLSGHPTFCAELVACADEARARPHGAARQRVCDRIARAIEPFDVAGLGREGQRNWYPVRAADLMAAASRLDASEDAIRRLLARSGFTTATSREPHGL